MSEVFDRNLCNVTCGVKSGIYCGGHTSYDLDRPRLGYFRCTTENCLHGCSLKRNIQAPEGCIFSMTKWLQHCGVITPDNILTVGEDGSQISLPNWLINKGKAYFDSGEITVGSIIDILDPRGRYSRAVVSQIFQGRFQNFAQVIYYHPDRSETLNLAQELFRHVPDPGAEADARMIAAVGQSSLVSAPTTSEVGALAVMHSFQRAQLTTNEELAASGDGAGPPGTIKQAPPHSALAQAFVTPHQHDLVAPDTLQPHDPSSSLSRKRPRETINQLAAEMETDLEEAYTRIKELDEKLVRMEAMLKTEQVSASELRKERDAAAKNEVAAQNALREKQAELERIQRDLDAKFITECNAVQNLSVIELNCQGLRRELDSEREQRQQLQTQLQQKNQILEDIRFRLGLKLPTGSNAPTEPEITAPNSASDDGSMASASASE